MIKRMIALIRNTTYSKYSLLGMNPLFVCCSAYFCLFYTHVLLNAIGNSAFSYCVWSLHFVTPTLHFPYFNCKWWQSESEGSLKAKICFQLLLFLIIIIKKNTSCYFNTQKSNQEHDVVRCLGHKRASAENLQEPGTEGPAGGMKRIAPRCML